MKIKAEYIFHSNRPCWECGHSLAYISNICIYKCAYCWFEISEERYKWKIKVKEDKPKQSRYIKLINFIFNQKKWQPVQPA